MTYVLGSLGVGTLGANPTVPSFEASGVLMATSLVADAALRPVIKLHLAANPTASNWAIFNLTRFGKSVTDAQANQMADNQQYVQPYKAFRDAVAAALRPINKSRELANALRYHLYELIDQERAVMTKAGFIEPPPPPSGGGGAGAASTTDNTMLYVGLAAAAVIGIGLMRRRQ